MKNDAKFEKEPTCQFKTDMSYLTNLDASTQKSQKFVEELCLMTLKIDANFEGKLTCAFKNGMKNLAYFRSQAENSDFILESKMVELNQNTNSKEPDPPDTV